MNAPNGIAKPESIKTSGLMKILLSATFILLILGWLMLFDTGLIFEGKANYAHYAGLIETRALATAFGLGLLLLVWFLPLGNLRKYAPVVILFAIVILAMVWSPWGLSKRGSTRWVDLRFISIQPLEFAKLAIVWFLAAAFTRIGPLRNAKLSQLVYPGLIFAIVMCMVVFQPNLSGAIFLILAAFAMALIAQMNGRIALGMVLMAGGAFAGMMALHPDKLERFLPVFSPLSKLDSSGYQVGMSLWAIVNGGWFGLGPSGSIAMYSLPDHSTDFIFSIICEEWGIIGGLAVIAIFCVAVFTAFKIGLSQRDPFRLMFGCGIATILGLEVAINIGVTLGILPTTGIPLPLLSAGGSNLIITLAEIGLLLNLAKKPEFIEQIPTIKIPEKDKKESSAPRRKHIPLGRERTQFHREFSDYTEVRRRIAR
ncbi:MAG: FtsW/RodA/SpoVE family cell cycle protein [bacterium]